MQHEEIINCPKSGGDLCYKVQVAPEIYNYMSISCGFWTNSLMTEGSEFYTEQFEVLPELYKDLKFKDKNGMVWFPSTTNLSNEGMVFANGSSVNNWKWSAVKAIKIPKKEQIKYPKPGKKDQYYKYRMDMTTIKHFEERDFMDALSYIGVLPS